MIVFCFNFTQTCCLVIFENVQERKMNMKKGYLFGLLVSMMGSAACADAPAGCPKAFQGFYLGGNIGYGIAFVKQKLFRFDPVVAANGDALNNINNELRSRGVDGGIGVGYTHRLGNWALGLSFDANWAKVNGHSIVAERTVAPHTLKDVNTRAHLKQSLQLYVRGGYVICEKVMPFAGLGWDNSRWRQSADVFATDNPEPFTIGQNKRFNAFLWKFGVDFLATQHVVVGFEYTGTVAGRKSFDAHNPFAGSTETYKGSIKPQYNKFALTAKIVY